MKRGRLTARGFAAALSFGVLVTGVALGQTLPSPPPESGQIPGVPGIIMPSPLPQPTISGTPIPYPAYGSPAPDVEQLKPRKGVPQTDLAGRRDPHRRGALADICARERAMGGDSR